MKTKTEKAINLWREGFREKSLKIFKTFKIGVTKEQKRILEISYEMSTGNESFYVSLGFNKSKINEEADQIIKQLYSV